MPTRDAYRPPAIEPDARAETGLIGFLRAMVSNPVSAIPRSSYEQDLIVLRLGGARVAIISSPALLEEVLVKRPQDFPKSYVDERILKPAVGNSLLITHGEDWRWKRRLAAPYFSPAGLAKSVPGMIAPFDALARRWRAQAPGTVVDVSTSVTQATAEVISAALFTNQDEMNVGALAEAINRYLEPISWTIGLASLNIPAWLPHPGKRQIRLAQAKMRSLVAELIAARRESKRPYHDICSDMMGAKDPETGRPLSDDDLVDMLLTLVAAGHETSANALTWILFCLAEQPQLQDEVRAEVRAVAGERPIAAADLPALVTVEAVIRETMRLFPPAPLLARRTTRTERLGDQEFRIGTTLFIPIYAVHRHTQLWPEPDRFDVGRFLGEEGKRMQRTTYLPFGAGPRVCIGGAFAMTEMVAATATLLQRLTFSTTGTTRCEPIQRITLRPKDGLQLAVRPA